MPIGTSAIGTTLAFCYICPRLAPAVRMYCCGPTVYHFAHIGNLRTYIFEDFLVRTLKYYGYKVNHIVNITDVGHLTSDADSGDDKMEKGAAREGKSVWDIAKFYTDAFMADWHRLNIQEPTRWTPATQHIQEQIDLVKTLEEKGYTYRTSDGIYFDSLKFPRYADFARLDVENLRKGSRIDMGEKHNATDFAHRHGRKEERHRLCPVEVQPEGQEARHGMGQPVGRWIPRLAHRMLRHGHEVQRPDA